MKSLQNLPILVKLVIAPMSLLIVMGVLALVVNNTMNRTEAALSRLMDALDRKSRILADAQRTTTEVQAEMYRIVGLMGNQAEVRLLRERTAQVQEQIANIRMEFLALRESSLVTAEESELSEDVTANLNAYSASVGKMADALDSEFPIAIMFIVGVEQSYDRVRRRIFDFSQLNRSTNQQIYDEARSRSQFGQELMLLLIVAGILVGGMITFLTSRMINLPITAITSAMSRLAREGETDLQVPGIERRDEIGSMARALEVFRDNAIKIKETEEQLRQAQKMEAIGQLTGGVAHDFNNILATIMGNAEILELRYGKEHRAPQSIIRAASRGADLTQHLLAFSRKQSLRPQAVDLDRLVAGLSDILHRTLGEVIEVRRSSEEGLLPVYVDPGQLENALLNLAINARDAMPRGGTLTIEAANVQIESEDGAAEDGGAGTTPYVLLTVKDTGHGMSEQILQHAIEPFFTTKTVGEGSGLGLSMVYGLVKQTGGQMTIDSAEGLGTAVKLLLPSVPGEAVTVPQQRSTEEPSGHGETILVLEDDLEVRKVTVSMLESLGYEVVAAADGRSALALLEQLPRVDLLLTDIVLTGGLSGPKVADRAMRDHAGIRILFMSGHPEKAFREEVLPDIGFELLRKPYRRQELAQRVHAVINQARDTEDKVITFPAHDRPGY